VACLKFHPALWLAESDRIVRKLVKKGSLQKRPAENNPERTTGVGRGEGMHTTEVLAEFVYGLQPGDLNESVREAARRCLLDLMGAACAGQRTESARAMLRAAKRFFGAGKSLSWFSGDKLTALGAALINAASASAMDLDDGHRGAAGHPGASIIPAAFAVAQETAADAQDFLSAVVLGYDIACRVGAARDFGKLQTLSTGRWCACGAAAVAGRLKRLKPPALAQALSIAGAQVPDLAASGYSRIMGNHVKEGIPWSTMLGVAAADLAAEGFSGPLDIFDHPEYFDSAKMTADLGKAWAIEEVYFKLYSCCRWSHAAIDALLGIMRENSLNPKSIRRIKAETFERALRLNNYPDPDTLEAAQYSIPFCLGVAAVKGPDALLPLETASLHDRCSVDLAQRVELAVKADMNRLFPAQAPARVFVETSAGTFAKTVINPKGDPANPFTPEELETKFRRLSEARMSEDTQRKVEQAVAELDRGGFQRLSCLLGYV
jgi:2-methylcitrate dehydratase PrpD